MPEEAQSGAPEATPTPQAPEAPAQGTPEGTPEVNWTEEGPRFQKRYEDLRPQYDRTQQQLDSFEQRLNSGDPQAVAELLAEYGWELPQAEPEGETDEFDDPYEKLDQRLASIEEVLQGASQEQQQLAQQEAEVGFINDQLETIQKDTGHQFSEQEAQVVGDLSQVNRDDQGRPDVRGAYESVFNQLLPEQKKAWTETKKAPRAASGASAVEQPDLDNPRERAEYMAQRLQEESQQ